jgi:ribosomal protein S18 acetylase RimI-like enzyme
MVDLQGKTMIGSAIDYRRPGTLSVDEIDELRGMVRQVADDFVPSLAARSSTTQSDLNSVRAIGIDAYLTELLTQHTLLAHATDGSAAAFLSFRSNYVHPKFPELGACVYVSTIAVVRAFRREGFARDLYSVLFRLDHALPRRILLRTWADNISHLSLLAELGFDILGRAADDRGPGVDTVYLGITRSQLSE